MPRPITKEDIKEDRDLIKENGYRVIKDEVLGIVIFNPLVIFNPRGPRGPCCLYSYNMTANGNWLWVGKRTFKRRQKLGHIKPRGKRKAKPKMPEVDFSLDEIALAESIMEGM